MSGTPKGRSSRRSVRGDGAVLPLVWWRRSNDAVFD